VPLGGSAHLLDGSTPVTSLTVPDEGSYVIDTSTGVISFTAVLGFSGTATPVPYRITNPIDESGDSTYTPTVTKPSIATPPAKTSTGVGTDPQDVTLTAPTSGQVDLMDGATPTTTLTVPGEGTYVLDPGTGDVTFTPVLGFSGTATPITYRVTDAYGQHATNTITPTVTKPPIAAPPNKTSTGAGTEPQVRQLAIPPSGGIALLDGGGHPRRPSPCRGRAPIRSIPPPAR
jgi:CshA-type fibril repeat protein